MRFLRVLLMFNLLMALAACGSANSSIPATPTNLVSVNQYDPARDPAQDLRAAIEVASKDGKRILLEVGGDWCIWCHRMDGFFEDNAELLKLREANFVLVKVNYSEENQNETFLGQYPDVAGYPHLFVLDGDGKLLKSQDTGELELGKTYNLQKFMAFLQKWVKA